MPENIYEFRFQRGTSDRWTALNPVLGPGEPGVELDTGLFKIGDGSTEWNELEYYLTEFYITALIDVAVAASGGLSSDPRIGNMEDLTTTSQDLLVSAINEVNAKAASLQADVDALQIDVASMPLYVPFGRAGMLIPFTGPKFYFTDDVTFVDSTFSLTTSPTGSSVVLDVLKNGSSIYSSNPAIAASGSLASAGTLAGTPTFAARTDVLQVKCLQIGSIIPGSDLAVLLKLIPA